MNSGLEDIGAVALDNPIVDPLTGLPEDVNIWTKDDADPQRAIKGLRSSLALAITLWSVIILTLVELF